MKGYIIDGKKLQELKSQKNYEGALSLEELEAIERNVQTFRGIINCGDYSVSPIFGTFGKMLMDGREEAWWLYDGQVIAILHHSPKGVVVNINFKAISEIWDSFSCDFACSYFKIVADKLIRWFFDGFYIDGFVYIPIDEEIAEMDSSGATWWDVTYLRIDERDFGGKFWVENEGDDHYRRQRSQFTEGLGITGLSEIK